MWLKLYTLLSVFPSRAWWFRTVYENCAIVNCITSLEAVIERMAEELMRSPGYEIMFQNAVASYLDSYSGNLSHAISHASQLNAPLNLRHMDLAFLSNLTNSGTSFEESLLTTDANSTLFSGSYLRSSAINNRDSYLNLPSSPLSSSSSSLQISQSSTVDCFPLLQKTSQVGKSFLQRCDRHQEQLGSSISTSWPISQAGQVSVPSRTMLDGSIHMHKKPRFDIGHEDFLLQNMIQDLLQKMKMQSNDSKLFPMVPQNMSQNQREKQTFLAVPQSQKIHSEAFLPQQPIRPQQKHPTQSQDPAVLALNSGICARRLMHYIYHLRHRPPDNNIAYWRKFVAEYYASCAKKRWCLSKYDISGHHARGIFSQAALCNICGTKFGRGFEASFEVLPRLCKINFDSGVIDELLYLDCPQERILPLGFFMLQYGKAIQESVYKHVRVVHEGQLHITFTQELKIVSWEFCGQRYEELVPYRLLASQVNQLIDAAQKYKNSSQGNRHGEFSTQDLLSDCNRFVSASCQLSRNLELQLVSDVGLSKQYVRCLQISEIVNCMKDLMSYSHTNNISPIESLKRYAVESTLAKERSRRQSPIPFLDSNKSILIYPNRPISSENQSLLPSIQNYYPKLPINESMEKLEPAHSVNSTSNYGSSLLAYKGARKGKVKVSRRANESEPGGSRARGGHAASWGKGLESIREKGVGSEPGKSSLRTLPDFNLVKSEQEDHLSFPAFSQVFVKNEAFDSDQVNIFPSW
ncbi:hypothetical protein Nepgr_030721 [Nepenthes gracilis]|uniref:Transcriptional regulator SLK2 n=1 Tax=Nepenthes gracilis TaxID=150966 RepID=A0AAD3TFA8_NEPGR|nr:hypothetical protein Nepgr_030721 [Nepenthes gracilis]